MGIARRQNHRAFRAALPLLQRKKQHGTDALRGALRPINRPAKAKKRVRIFLACRNNALRLVKLIRAANLRNISIFAPQKGHALVPRHVETGGALRFVFLYEITNRCIHKIFLFIITQACVISLSCKHAAAPLYSLASLTFIMMAHSILFLNKSQPYS